MWGLLSSPSALKSISKLPRVHAAAAAATQIPCNDAAAACATTAAAAAPTAYRSWSSTTHADPFGSPPQLPQRRVVVTGVGIVSPVGVGAAASWQAIVAGRTGTRKLLAEDLPEVGAAFHAIAGLLFCTPPSQGHSTPTQANPPP
jgi:hypothetical protein